MGDQFSSKMRVREARALQRELVRRLVALVADPRTPKSFKQAFCVNREIKQ